jgi:hypothetical protein
MLIDHCDSNSVGGLLDAGLSGAGKVEGELQHTKALTVTAKGVFSHKFDKETLLNAIPTGKWKPRKIHRVPQCLPSPGASACQAISGGCDTSYGISRTAVIREQLLFQSKSLPPPLSHVQQLVLSLLCKKAFSLTQDGLLMLLTMGLICFQTVRAEAPTLLEKGVHRVWIINEVFYAASIDVTFHDGASVKAEVAAMPGIPGGLGAGVNASGDVRFILWTSLGGRT